MRSTGDQVLSGRGTRRGLLRARERHRWTVELQGQTTVRSVDGLTIDRHQRLQGGNELQRLPDAD